MDEKFQSELIRINNEIEIDWTEDPMQDRVWSEFKPEDVRRLREVGRRALLRAGAQPWQVTDREIDKWLESRARTILHQFNEKLKRLGR